MAGHDGQGCQLLRAVCGRRGDAGRQVLGVSVAEALQIIGTCSIAAIASTCVYVAANRARWCLFGRDAMWCLIGLVWQVVVVRCLAIVALVSQHDARTWNGLISILFLIALVQIVFLHVTWHRKGLAT